MAVATDTEGIVFVPRQEAKQETETTLDTIPSDTDSEPDKKEKEEEYGQTKKKRKVAHGQTPRKIKKTESLVPVMETILTNRRARKESTTDSMDTMSNDVVSDTVSTDDPVSGTNDFEPDDRLFSQDIHSEADIKTEVETLLSIAHERKRKSLFVPVGGLRVTDDVPLDTGPVTDIPVIQSTPDNDPGLTKSLGRSTIVTDMEKDRLWKSFVAPSTNTALTNLVTRPTDPVPRDTSRVAGSGSNVPPVVKPGLAFGVKSTASVTPRRPTVVIVTQPSSNGQSRLPLTKSAKTPPLDITMSSVVPRPPTNYPQSVGNHRTSQQTMSNQHSLMRQQSAQQSPNQQSPVNHQQPMDITPVVMTSQPSLMDQLPLNRQSSMNTIQSVSDPLTRLSSSHSHSNASNTSRPSEPTLVGDPNALLQQCVDTIAQLDHVGTQLYVFTSRIKDILTGINGTITDIKQNMSNNWTFK